MAGSVSFSGLGSGIDFSKLTDSIVAARSRPISLLQSKSSDLTKRSDAFKQLNTKLATLTSAAEALTDQDLGTGRLASSSATDKVVVTADATAAKGALNVTVTRLASSLTQSSRVYTSKTNAVLAGGATTATFELRKGDDTSGTEITINSANDTLEGLRDAINDADAGVTATIVDTNGAGTSYKLVLTSSDTGAEGRVQLVETTATGTGTDINLTSLNPPGATNDFSDLDAEFDVNGLTLTRSSNTVTDAVEGVTLTLKDEGSAKISVSASTSDISSKLRAFITAYNDVHDFISSQSRKDGSGKAGAFLGDAIARSVQRQLRDVVGGSSSDNGGALTNLTQLGIGRDENGKLTLDSTVLDEQLANSLDDVKALLAGASASETGIANQLYDTASLLSDDITGIVQTTINRYQSSIKSLDKSISDQLARISVLRESLSRQFAAADAAISGLNNQNTALTNLLKSLDTSNNK
ncbi:MAG: flagellar filament capping protein FliD [Acidobacteria bacterium]|nr:flagellar filament capping protein FliD [Acidobacteriota bacterium]